MDEHMGHVDDIRGVIISILRRGRSMNQHTATAILAQLLVHALLLLLYRVTHQVCQNLSLTLM